jgi:drug/metabolite transporter (DMT)-like permease
MTRNTPYGWIFVALGAMCWGSDILLRAPLAQTLPAATIVLAEHVALCVLFVPILIRYRAEWLGLARREWLGLLFLAWAGSAISTVLLTKANALGSPLTATLLQKTQPLFAVALAGVVLRERRTALFWVLLGIAGVGAYLLSFGFLNPADALADPHALAALCALGAAALWGACTVVGRLVLGDNVRPAVVTGWRFVLAVPLLIVLGSAGWHHGALQAVLQPDVVVRLALIVLLPDVLGMSLYYVGLARTPASVATLAELAYPLTALLFGELFAHQRLSTGQWCGLCLLLISLQAIQWSQSVKPASAPHVDQIAVPGPLQET